MERKEVADVQQRIAEVLLTFDWHVYPEESVVANVKEGDWVAWLDERCNELGHA
jgi:hypothetical protein